MNTLTRRDIEVTGLYDLQAEIANRIAARRRFGPFDHSSDSYDNRVAMTRAVRVFFRIVRNTRLSVNRASGY